jgi:hypothetical protein
MMINQGEPAVRAEFERLLPWMRGGGFIPGVERPASSGVSLQQSPDDQFQAMKFN